MAHTSNAATEGGLAAFVQRRRIELELSPDQLLDAFYAEVNLLKREEGHQTIKRDSAKRTLRAALRGRRMYAISLKALGSALGCLDEIERFVTQRRATKAAGALPSPVSGNPHSALSMAKSYESWWVDDIRELVRSAESKLLFVDTWFDDGSHFRPLIQERKQRTDKQTLLVELYLLSNKAVGGQRIGEIRSLPAAERKTRALSLEREYERLFEGGIGEASLAFGDPSVKLNLFGYHLMPGLRVLVVDEKTYIFSWFPVGAMSAENVCFCISAESPATSDQRAITCLNSHIAAIIKHAVPIDGEMVDSR